MKTRTTTIGKRIAMMMILTILVNAAFAQNRHRANWNVTSLTYGVGYSGNGLGMTNELSLGFGSDNNQFEFSVLTTQRPVTLNGVQANYQYFLIESKESTSLFVTTMASYRMKSQLTGDLNLLMHSKDFVGEYERYNTLDLSAGFGLKQRLVAGLCIETSICLDYYTRQLASLKDNRNVDFARYSADSGIGLNLKLGITYEF